MIVLGKYKEIYKNNQYPSIKSDINIPSEHKEIVLEYMRNAKVSSYSPTIALDVIDGSRIKESLCFFTDGVYAWRSDLIYYIEKYNLKIPTDFISHILERKAM